MNLGLFDRWAAVCVFAGIAAWQFGSEGEYLLPAFFAGYWLHNAIRLTKRDILRRRRWAARYADAFWRREKFERDIERKDNSL